MTETATSKGGATIRLTDERWGHITEEHAELAGYRLELMGTVAEPDRIVSGSVGELLALKKQIDGKTLVVVYRESANDGFVITAFLTRRETSLRRRKQLWPRTKSKNF
jgi:hypothetical protein